MLVGNKAVSSLAAIFCLEKRMLYLRFYTCQQKIAFIILQPLHVQRLTTRNFKEEIFKKPRLYENFLLYKLVNYAIIVLE